MKWKQQARVLMGKAAEDEFILLKLLPDPASPDSGIGFHAQQAAEKLLKAVLNIRRVSYRRTHELSELIDLLKKAGVELPQDLQDLPRLSPFAVQFRYDDPGDLSSDPMDRQWVRNIIQSARQWADSYVST